MFFSKTLILIYLFAFSPPLEIMLYNLYYVNFCVYFLKKQCTVEQLFKDSFAAFPVAEFEV